MSSLAASIRRQLARQVAHWVSAASRLQKPEDLASPDAWGYLERYLGVTIRNHLTASVERLRNRGAALSSSFEAAASLAELAAIQRQLLDFRRRYLRTETTLDFYADAINSRTNPNLGAYLRACDSLAHRSMASLLDQLGQPIPVVLTYVDKGIGASILRAGLRLWDGTDSPAAAIKITRHNLQRPTALIHEAGHQCCAIAGWNEELRSVLCEGIGRVSPSVARTWSSWASEIGADAFAFVHTGYASVAALHDVLAGDPAHALRLLPGDPHPIGYLRVLLGVETCRACYGAGPWDDLAEAWVHRLPIERAERSVVQLIRESLPLLPQVVHLTLHTPMQAFGRRSLGSLVNPDRIRPSALEDLERRLGPALFTSTHWVWTECLRLLALVGLKLAVFPERADALLADQEAWMRRLGGSAQAA